MRTPKPSDSGGEFTLPDPGTYTLEFTDYDEPSLSQFTRDDGAEYYRVKFVWTIRDDEDFGDTELWAWYGWTMSPKGKLNPVLKALMGREIDEDEDIELDDLIGKRVTGTIDHKPNKEGIIRANVIAVAPMRKRSRPSNPNTVTGTRPPAKAAKPTTSVDDDGDELFDEAV